MRHFHDAKNPSFTPTVNVDHLWHLLGGETGVAAAKAAGGKAPVVDVSKFGYFKVLGKGLLPKVPIVVKARFVSAIAEKKIRAAGGAVVLTA
jgi:large subunit ribosomal protein L27Ae